METLTYEYKGWLVEAMTNKNDQWYAVLHHPTDRSGDSDMITAAYLYLLDTLAIARYKIVSQ